MNRAGREPAEDLKSRLVTACREVGLVVSNASMHLSNTHKSRRVLVEASPEAWSGNTSMVSVIASIPTSGQWPESVDIRCNGSENNDFSGPWMKGRQKVPLGELIQELLATLREREQVIALIRSGEVGPFVFEQTTWDRVDLLDGFDPTQ